MCGMWAKGGGERERETRLSEKSTSGGEFAIYIYVSRKTGVCVTYGQKMGCERRVCDRLVCERLVCEKDLCRLVCERLALLQRRVAARGLEGSCSESVRPILESPKRWGWDAGLGGR